MKKLTLLSLILFFTSAVTAQNLSKTHPDLLKNAWPAKWIAPSTSSLQNYGVFHFRKAFNIAEVPGEFVINISADNRYRLFVNGVAVTSGPARGDVSHWRFETLDIAPFLTKGKNIVAVQVWNFGENRAWAQITHQTGLVIQGNTSREEILNTDTSWKVIENTAYTPVANIAHITGPGDLVFAQRYPWNWEKADYDDKNWSSAAETETAVPAGATAFGVRRLVQRTIPLPEEKLQKVTTIRRFEGLPANDDFLTGKGIARKRS